MHSDTKIYMGKKMKTFHYVPINSKRVEARKPCICSLPSGNCCALLNSSLVRGLSISLQNKLLSIGSSGIWKKGDHLFMEGSRVERFYYLFSGKVREYYFNSSGEEFLRRVVYPDHYISLHNIFNTNRTYTYYSEVLTTINAFSWPVDAFLDILCSNPELGLHVATVLSMTIERSCRQNCLCRKARGTQKVAGYLLSKQKSCYSTSSYCPEAECCRKIDLRPVSLAAQEVCMARETFSRILISFQKKKIISTNRGMITILDSDTLKAICGIE